MSVRKVKPYKGNYIQKFPDIKRIIPKIADLEELEKLKKEFSRVEYLGLYQTFYELYIYDCATWEERSIICPIVDLKYSPNNIPILIMPKMCPLAGEDESYRYEEDDIPIELASRIAAKGYTDEEIGIFLEKITNFCVEWNLNESDILLNLNNLGYSREFGLRVIDYGLTETVCEELYR